MSHQVAWVVLVMLGATCGDGPDGASDGGADASSTTPTDGGGPVDASGPPPDAAPPVVGGELQWVTAATGGNIYPTAVASFPDDSVIVSGYYQRSFSVPGSSGLLTLPYSNGINNNGIAFMVRIDSAGRALWTRRADGIGGLPTDVVALPDGTSLIVGFFSTSIVFGPGETNETQLDADSGGGPGFLAKLSANGDVIWAKQTASTHGLATFSNGDIAISGQFGTAVTLGVGEANETTLTAVASGQYLARLTPAGELVWARKIVEPYVGLGQLRIDPMDRISISAQSRYTTVVGPGDPGETTFSGGGSAELLVAAFNADGSVRWARTGMGAGLDGANAHSVFADGSLLVAGRMQDSITLNAGLPDEVTLVGYEDSQDILLCHYGIDGALLWARREGGTSLDGAASTGIRANGSFIVAGRFSYTGVFGDGDGVSIALQGGIGDAFIAYYQAGPEVSWARRAGGGDLDWVNEIAILSDDSTLAVGRFDGAAVFGEGEPNQETISSPNGTGMFIARLAP